MSEQIRFLQMFAQYLPPEEVSGLLNNAVIINADIDAEHFCFYMYKYEGKNHCVRQPFVPTVFEYENGVMKKVSLQNNELNKEE